MYAHLLFSAKNIECIGDHATNITETIYFLIHGKTLDDERPKSDTTKAFLVATPFFGGLSDASLALLISMMIERCFDVGATVVAEGDGAGDPKRLGARFGITPVLHTAPMTHHPHVHMIVPGGGLSKDRTKWIACRPDFFLPVRVLSRLFRRRVLAMLLEAYNSASSLSMPRSPSAKPLLLSFGPLSAPNGWFMRKVKDYRLDGAARFKIMTLATGEFIRRFLMHVCPRASIASAIMACLPMAAAPGTSPKRARCSLCL